jgi:hypothetical protein
VLVLELTIDHSLVSWHLRPTPSARARRALYHWSNDVGIATPGRPYSRIGFCGEFYGQQHNGQPYPKGLTIANLIRLVGAMGADWTELMSHPGYAHDLDSIYAAERERAGEPADHPPD